MGQRSQIYIRYNGKLIVANYYQWNYGERMISRTRSILDKVEQYCEYPKYYFEDSHSIETLRRFCDVNFDYRDIVRSSNIFEEYKLEKYCSILDCYGKEVTKNEYIFDMQDNNDGQLFVDVRVEFEHSEENGKEVPKPEIKYCFRNSDLAGPFTADDYWSWYSDYPLEGDVELVNRENIERIKEFSVMTEEEMIQFTEGEV